MKQTLQDLEATSSLSHTILKKDYSMQPIPLLSEDLIKQLDELFPEKCPDLNDPERAIWMYAGSRLVIRNLKARLQFTIEESQKELFNVHGSKASVDTRST